MTLIRMFFQLNQPIIQFGYGLTFFVMGLAIAFQSRRSSRLELARSLAWLALFGITHGLYIWAELFAPVQEAYLDRTGILILHSLHLMFLGFSFLCLFEFGEALLNPLPRGRWMHPITYLLMAVYFIAILALPLLIPAVKEWHSVSEALARYFIGLPGSLLAAYSLRDQTYRYIAPFQAPQIVRNLRVAGIALLIFAFFGGLIPPPVPFFPGSILNEQSFENLTGLPSLVFQILVSLALAVTIIRALDIFNVEIEGRIEQMEQQQILTSERERIARDLHDGSIQLVYTAGLLVDSARKLVEPGSPAYSRLEKAVEVLNDAITDLRRNLVQLRSAPSKESLEDALTRLANDPRFHSLVQVSLEIALPKDYNLSPLQTEHILSIVNEAMSNILRHSGARRAVISARDVNHALKLVIHDDGAGFSSSQAPGFGLRNMQDRARLLGGRLEVKSEPGKGTTVLLEVPWQDESQPERINEMPHE